MSQTTFKLLLIAVLMVTAGWCANPIRLRETVEVNHPKVTLGDLLPPYSPEALRRGIGTVELCAAPRRGELRLLLREQIADRMSQKWATLDGLIIPERVLVRNPGSPITEEMVRNAVTVFLSRKGWPHGLPQSSSIVFPRVTAEDSGFQLEVVESSWNVRQEAFEIRLHCSNRSCGNFLAHLCLPDSLSEGERSALLRSMLSGRLVAQREIPPQLPVLVMRGRPATLVLQDAKTQISLPVVCLQAGGLKQEVRVFEKQSRQIFEAEVIGRNLLRASL